MAHERAELNDDLRALIAENNRQSIDCLPGLRHTPVGSQDRLS